MLSTFRQKRHASNIESSRKVEMIKEMLLCYVCSIDSITSVNQLLQFLSLGAMLHISTTRSPMKRLVRAVVVRLGLFGRSRHIYAFERRSTSCKPLATRRRCRNEKKEHDAHIARNIAMMMMLWLLPMERWKMLANRIFKESCNVCMCRIAG